MPKHKDDDSFNKGLRDEQKTAEFSKFPFREQVVDIEKDHHKEI